MPLPQKKKVKNEEEIERKDESMEQEQDFDDDSSENDDDYDDSDLGSDENEEFDPNEEIMIDFEARAPDQYDLEPIKVLLSQKLAPFQSINVNDLAKIIVEQDNIGNVIYQAFNDEDEEESDKKDTKSDDNNNDEDTIFGVLSLVELNPSKHKQFSSNLITFLLNECEKFDKSNKSDSYKIKDKLGDILKNNNVSYIINERYINVPAGISVPMYESLLKDLNKVKGDEESSKSDDNLGYWLFLTKVFLETASAKSSKKTTTEKLYANPEEETFEEFADLKFDLSNDSKSAKNATGGWSMNDETLRPVLSCMLIPKNKVNEALTKIKSLIK